MEEKLVSFNTAKLAKEKGFDISTNKYWCNYYIDEPFNKWKLLPTEELSISFMEFAAPTQSLLQKWLREVHNIHLVIKPRFKGDLNNPIVDYSYNGEKGDRNNIFYPTYEEALEVGLQEALKLIEYGRTKSKF